MPFSKVKVFNQLLSIFYPMMKQRISLMLLTFTFWVGMPSCKTEFEKIRTSNNTQVIAQKADEYYEKGNWMNAQMLYEIVMPSMRTSPNIEKMAYRYSYTHYNLRSYESASYYFKNFATTYTNSPYKEEADFMVAYAQYRMSPRFRLDQDNTRKAIEGFEAFVNTYPESKRIKECNKLIDEMRKKLEIKAVEEGKLYFDMRQYQSAMQVFENVLREYPETAEAEQIRWRLLQAQFLWAENSILEKQSERFKTVVDKYKEFVSRFPKSKNREEADKYLKIANQKIKELQNVRYQKQSTGS